MVPQNKKLNVKRLMKYFSHDYSDHDQSKAREMATLQLKYLNALLFITVAVLQQQATINHINHPSKLNSEIPFLSHKMAVLLLKLMKRLFFCDSDFKKLLLKKSLRQKLQGEL